MYDVNLIVAPVFGLIALGFLLARFAVLSEAAGKGLTEFVFTAAIPALLFRMMVTADEIADPTAMKLSTRLNGEQVQSTMVASMIFNIPAIVSYVSSFIYLKPGDIISTGSPAGSGGSRQPQRFLIPGDELEIEWSGVGTLRNKVEEAG